MSNVYINYKKLEASVKKSSQVRKKIFDYTDEINKKITSPIPELRGKDFCGYTSTASELAKKKIESLSQKVSRFEKYEDTVTKVISAAKIKDRHVANEIERLANLNFEPRNWFQKTGDAVYNFFCVDLANKWGWSKTIANITNGIRQKYEDVRYATEKLTDWFKYYEGKYWMNIGTTVLKAVSAVGAVIVAVLSIPVTGPAAMIIGYVIACAASISMLITLYNSEASINENINAIHLDRDGNTGMARYYGNIKKLSDKWKKTDMGNASTNKFYRRMGHFIDGAKTVADCVQVVGSFAKLGIVRDFRFTAHPELGNKGYSFTWSNIKRNILHDMKIYTSKLGKRNVRWSEKVNWKKTFTSEKILGGYEIKDFSIDKTLMISEELYHILNIGKFGKNVCDVFEDVHNIIDSLNSNTYGYENFFKPISKVNYLFAPTGEIVEKVNDIIETGKNWIEWGEGFAKPTPFPELQHAE